MKSAIPTRPRRTAVEVASSVGAVFEAAGVLVVVTVMVLVGCLGKVCVNIRILMRCSSSFISVLTSSSLRPTTLPIHYYRQ